MKKILLFCLMAMVAVAGFAQKQKKPTAAETKVFMDLWHTELYEEMSADEVNIEFKDLDGDGQDEVLMSTPGISGYSGFMILSKHNGKYVVDFADASTNNGAFELLADGFATYSYSIGRQVNDDFIFDELSIVEYLKYENSTLMLNVICAWQLKDGVDAAKVTEENYDKCIDESFVLRVCGQEIKITREDADKIVPLF